jgi:hypothetical protein
MSCIELPKPARQQVDPVDTSWEGIAEAIRAHAATQPSELSRELREWADLMVAIAEFQAKSAQR